MEKRTQHTLDKTTYCLIEITSNEKSNLDLNTIISEISNQFKIYSFADHSNKIREEYKNLNKNIK